MNAFEATVPQLIKMLKNLDKWIAAAVEHAKKKNFEPDVFVAARLAPDQYAFGRQVQVCCDSAKFIASRLTGKEAPSHPDTEKTMEELRARVQTVVTHLETYKKEDFEKASERHISLPWMEGKWMTGDEHVTEFALPNFYFHTTTAYAILRHNGVDLGKRDFIGSVPMREPEKAAS